MRWFAALVVFTALVAVAAVRFSRVNRLMRDTRTVEIELRPSHWLTPAEGERLSVLLFSRRLGKPLFRPAVCRQGRLQMDNVPNLAFEGVIRAPPYGARLLVQRGVDHASVRFSPMTRVEVEVVGHRGRPIPNASVHLSPADAEAGVCQLSDWTGQTYFSSFWDEVRIRVRLPGQRGWQELGGVHSLRGGKLRLRSQHP